jgi:hemerythrin-like domain-containing protein
MIFRYAEDRMPSTKTRKKSNNGKPSDAIALLKQDHEKVRKLLGTLENASGARRDKLLGQIEQELKIHTTIEEEIFYPAYREAARKKDDQVMFYEAVEEHHVVDRVLPDTHDGENDEDLKAKAKVLKELVEHHADEEEKDMFPRARKLMEREELRDLGARMEERKRELKRA